MTAFGGCIALNSVHFYGKKEPNNDGTVFDDSDITKINMPNDYKGETFCQILIHLSTKKFTFKQFSPYQQSYVTIFKFSLFYVFL